MKKAYGIAFLSVMMFFVTCTMDRDDEGEYPDNVYIAGSYWDDISYEAKVCYWADGVIYKLDGVLVTKIMASQGKVLVVGYYDNNDGHLTSCYWVDGARYDVPESVSPKSIILNNGTVYMAGGNSYWVDGIRWDLPRSNGTTTAIAVYNGKVFVAGISLSSASYWVYDGVHQVINDSALFFKPTTIAVTEGEHVYLAGINQRNQAYFSRNREIFTLSIPSPSIPYSIDTISISKGKVFVAGELRDTNSVPKPCYWVNGVLHRFDLPTDNADILPDGSNVYTITVSGGKVYAAGSFYGTSCFWVDGARYDIADRDFLPQAIFVEEK